MDIQDLILQYGVPLMAALILLGELGVPTGVPMELAMIVTGAFAIHSPQHLLFAILLMVLADMAGTLGLHLFARSSSGGILRRFSGPDGRSQRMLDQLRDRVGGGDVPLILVGRSLPFARMWVSLGAGITQLRLRSFLIGALGGAVIWVSIPVSLGYAFSSQIELFEQRYSSFARWAMLVMPMLMASLVIVSWVRRGSSLGHRLHRLRAASAAVGAVGSAGYLLLLANRHGWLDGGSPLPNAAADTFGLWAPLVIGIAVLLMVLAVADLWSARFLTAGPARRGHMLLWETTATASTLSLILVATIALRLLAERLPVL